MNNGKKLVLGIQHLFAMFGATVLVPTLTGMNPSVALICAGIGTLLFHWVTGNRVTVFLGSSFAYIGAINMAIAQKSQEAGIDHMIGNSINPEAVKHALPYVQSGIIAAGIVYILLGLLVKIIGVDNIKKLFPPVVTGPVIVVIGLTLAPTGIDMASNNWIIAIIVLLVIIAVQIFAKGFFKLVPILIGLATGYLISLACDGFKLFGDAAPALVNMQVFADADWISPFWKFGEFFTLPKFDWTSILIIAPIALVTFMEHIGDMTTNGSVVGKDYLKDPGLHRTILGDGIATVFAGLIGGPANTTYSENTGVLAVTKVYDTFVLKIAAFFAIGLALFGKFGAVLMSIPTAVLGGVSIILFGMIAAIGMRTLSEAQLDFTHSRNLIIVALILVFGLGMSNGIQITDTFTLSPLFIAVFIGAVANKLLPQDKESEKEAPEQQNA